MNLTRLVLRPDNRLSVIAEDGVEVLVLDQSSAQEAKIAKVMREFENGTLKSSNGETVTSRKQAQAIAFSEAGISND